MQAFVVNTSVRRKELVLHLPDCRYLRDNEWPVGTFDHHDQALVSVPGSRPCNKCLRGAL